MTNEEILDIYLTLTGQLIPEAAVPGVPDAFAEGTACTRLLEDTYDARDRIELRLGVTDDWDLECMIRGFEGMQAILCMEMFRLGFRAGGSLAAKQ